MITWGRKRDMSNKQKVLGELTKSILFLVFGTFLFIPLQAVFTPKWEAAPYYDYTDRTIRGFLNQSRNSVDVIALGTSHMLFGFDSMRLYVDKNIAAYNLGTTSQPIEVSYYLLETALERQKPKVVILDIGSLFWNKEHEEEKNKGSRRVIDALPLMDSKLALADWYTDENPQNRTETYLSSVFPMLLYHNRWAELTADDFTSRFTGDYYAKGYAIKPFIVRAYTSVDYMNYVADIMMDDVACSFVYSDNGRQGSVSSDPRYNPIIPEQQKEWLRKIAALCTDYQCTLLLTKIPAIRAPQEYAGAWTIVKHNAAVQAANEMGLRFVDLLYDADIGLDIASDFTDGGDHLNFCGAGKATAALENVILEYLDKDDLYPRDQYEKMIPAYKRVTEVAELEMTCSTEEYFRLLKEREQEIIIGISVSDEARAGLTETEMQLLAQLGLKSDFSKELHEHDSYIALIDGGIIKHEAVSNRELVYSYCSDDGVKIDLLSSGYFNGSKSSIQIDGQEYSENGRGINIVVIDKKSGLVIDSLSFDTGSPGPHSANRANWRNTWFKTFEEQFV